MSSCFLLKIAFGFALAGVCLTARGQGSAGPVIGYYKFQAPSGVSLWTCALTTKKEFQGRSSSVLTTASASTITQSGAAWVPGTFNLHFVEIIEGPWAGLVLDILQNTATTLQVEGNLGATGFNLGQNFRFAVRKHATLGAIFQGGAGLNAFDDSVSLLYEDGSRKKFFYDDTPPGRIVAADFSTSRDNEIVYPGQGLLLNCSGPRTITFGGGEVCYVKDTPTKIPLYGGRVNYVGQMNPVVALNPSGPVTADEASPLASAALGLADSNLSEYDDQITVFGRVGGVFSRLGAFYYDRTADTIVDTNGTPTSTAIPHGTALSVKPTRDRYLSQPAVLQAPTPIP